MDEIKVDDLVPLAVQYRAMAASQFQKDEDEYERLEGQADRLYAAAADHGLEFDRVDRLDDQWKPKRTKPCVFCGKDFQYKRKDAMYCSKSCRQKAAYYDEEAA